jgi:hypothetical protein
MRIIVIALWMALLSGIALAQDSDSAVGNETVTADQANDKAATDTVADAKEPEEFVPPPGYRMRKRGDKVLYCKKETDSGTRFAKERCYDEDRLKALVMSSEQDQVDLDQSRRVCLIQGQCGGT